MKHMAALYANEGDGMSTHAARTAYLVLFTVIGMATFRYL